jgi:hypothetical protein
VVDPGRSFYGGLQRPGTDHGEAGA